ncbi:MAG: response regulator transcription factor [Erysipelotrichaceae bacterium]
MKILIVDDNSQITSILTQYAIKEGYEVTKACDGKEALALFYAQPFDIILLDVMMPKINGFDVCKEIRQTSNIPIIMITARGEDFEKIMGLEIGADDYIVKPFSPNEVIARVKAIMRRSKNNSDNNDIIIIDNIIVNSKDYTTIIDNKKVMLTKKEFEILYTLISNRNKVFSRDNLLNSLWGYDYYGDNRTVDTHVKRLRSKLDKYHHPKWEISTVWGVGYKFEVNNE